MPNIDYLAPHLVAFDGKFSNTTDEISVEAFQAPYDLIL